MSRKDSNLPTRQDEQSEILLYQTEDGRIRLETRLQDETVWLTQDQMSTLFDKAKSTINEHIKNIFTEGELIPEKVMRKIGISEFSTKPTNFYNLDVIISVGYRVKSLRGTQFRIWATQRLREYIVKGFAMDDERLKKAGGGSYFDELLARIRDIRSSEKVFWRKVLDIYATSIDYDPKSDVSREFFKIIQNKMHWAAHGQTAAEVIYSRVDATQPNIGMTNWVGSRISKNETEIAKNYLTAEELDLLNRIVTLYLDFAELQAIQRKAMTMRDWIGKLDDFLKLSGRDILTHAGKISHDKALRKAHEEFEKFHVRQLEEPTEVEKHFVEAEAELKKIEATRKKEDKK
ncbi:virulence RhuM family protein [Desulfurivibrio sp. D14AmB]|uniref:virulence RhuM family protein n=1 Tax=Desulfurivibrio sp. D14AmB TaxID=3374370 RepID=UPI00376F0BFB